MLVHLTPEHFNMHINQKQREKLHPVKYANLQSTMTWISDKCIHLYDTNCYQDTEDCHHPMKFSHAPSQSIPRPILEASTVRGFFFPA